MTKIRYDEHWQPESSVISDVYYARDERLLFVRLHRDGVLCGYQKVHEFVLKQWKLQGSTGRYWNYSIKPYFEGYDTEGVELVRRGDVRKYEIVANVTRQETLVVFASDLDAALAEAHNKLEDDPTVVEYTLASATQFFEE